MGYFQFKENTTDQVLSIIIWTQLLCKKYWEIKWEYNSFKQINKSSYFFTQSFNISYGVDSVDWAQICGILVSFTVNLSKIWNITCKNKLNNCNICYDILFTNTYFILFKMIILLNFILSLTRIISLEMFDGR